MDQKALQAHLALTDRHMQEGEAHIVRQREIIRELERDGHSTGTARQILDLFEQLQTLHTNERDRISRELTELMHPPTRHAIATTSGWLAALRRDKSHLDQSSPR